VLRRSLRVITGAALLAIRGTRGPDARDTKYLVLGAEGNYEAMLLTCIDPRFPEPTIKHAKPQHGRQI
jgi:hypothetical protein